MPGLKLHGEMMGSFHVDASRDGARLEEFQSAAVPLQALPAAGRGLVPDEGGMRDNHAPTARQSGRMATRLAGARRTALRHACR
jgi:hypothetical protein